jgi:transcriptional regulator with XRE-family HTH domain
VELSANPYFDIVLAARDWVPERLAFARESAGLNRSELADRLNLTPSAVSQFEKGRTCPSADTIARMAHVLKVPVSSFGRPMGEVIDLTACRFGSQRGTSQVERRRATRLGAMLTWLLDEFGEGNAVLRQRFLELCSRVRRASDPEHMAGLVRNHVGLGSGPVPNMVGVLEDAGVVVVGWTGMVTGSFAGWRRDGLPVAFLDMNGLSPSRLRFEAAVQLSRLLLDQSGEDDRAGDTDQVELLAGAVLMPQESFGKEYLPRLSWSHLRALKRRWGVSIDDMVRRAFHLSLISEGTFRRRSSQLKRRGWRGREPDEPAIESPSRVLETVRVAVESGMDLSEVAMAVGVNESMLEELLRGSRLQPSLGVGL